MRDASVGFQCPECVREGARSTRSGRLPYGGMVRRNPRLGTFGLIAANVVVWLLLLATGGDNGRLTNALSLLPGGVCDNASRTGYYPDATHAVCTGTRFHWVDGVATGAWWQPVTSMFAHVEVLHIGFNMVALFFLGIMLEQILGLSRFLTVYLVSGLWGSAAVMLFADPQSQTLGASGAIFGLMGALVVVAIRLHGNLQSVLMWIGLNLVFTFTAGGISWEGHVGGLVGGLIAGAVIVYAPRTRRAPVQWAGLVALGVVAVLVIGLRAAALG